MYSVFMVVPIWQGSLEFLKHVTTIDNPFIIYNAHTDQESSRYKLIIVIYNHRVP